MGRLQMYRFIVASAIAISPAAAHASDGSRYLDLAKCIAYATVKGDLDGTKPIPQDYAVAIKTLGDEFLFEAKTLGFDDTQSQNTIVNELVRLNKLKQDKGIGAVKDELGQTCSDLADEMTPLKKPDLK